MCEKTEIKHQQMKHTSAVPPSSNPRGINLRMTDRMESNLFLTSFPHVSLCNSYIMKRVGLHTVRSGDCTVLVIDACRMHVSLWNENTKGLMLPLLSCLQPEIVMAVWFLYGSRSPLWKFGKIHKTAEGHHEWLSRAKRLGSSGLEVQGADRVITVSLASFSVK